MADNRAAIAAMETAIASGVLTVTTDGTTTTFRSQAEMERWLVNLKNTDTTGEVAQKPPIVRFNLTGF